MDDNALQLKIELQKPAEGPELVDFNVAWSKANDYIDLGMFPLPKMSEFYSGKGLTGRKIDLHQIKEKELIKEITSLALFFWNDKNVQSFNIHQSFISPLRKLVFIVKIANYESLTEVDYADVRKCFNHDWRALNFFNKFMLFCSDLKNKDNWLDKDIWDISKLTQDSSRIVPSKSTRF